MTQKLRPQFPVSYHIFLFACGSLTRELNMPWCQGLWHCIQDTVYVRTKLSKFCLKREVSRQFGREAAKFGGLSRAQRAFSIK